VQRFIIVLVIGIALYAILDSDSDFSESFSPDSAPGKGAISSVSRNGAIESAFQNQQSNLQVGGTGIVVRILSDDNDGSRHQRFILELPSGQTLLIAHNIDLAPRINSLREADTVEFYGEYEWNPQGGVVHWTHHDPGGSHENGWLKHNGAEYQ
jgi:hypothetical protein